MAKDQTLLDIMDQVGQALSEARPYGLQIEVMASAINNIKKDPDMDVSVALQNAMQDWDI
jgi:hypothetical protein